MKHIIYIIAIVLALVSCATSKKTTTSTIQERIVRDTLIVRDSFVVKTIAVYRDSVVRRDSIVLVKDTAGRIIAKERFVFDWKERVVNNNHQESHDEERTEKKDSQDKTSIQHTEKIVKSPIINSWKLRVFACIIVILIMGFVKWKLL